MKERGKDFEVGQLSLTGDAPKDVRDAYAAGLRRAASFVSQAAGFITNPEGTLLLERMSGELEQIAREEDSR